MSKEEIEYIVQCLTNTEKYYGFTGCNEDDEVNDKSVIDKTRTK